MEVDEERIRLESLAEELAASEGDGNPLLLSSLFIMKFIICYMIWVLSQDIYLFWFPKTVLPILS